MTSKPTSNYTYWVARARWVWGSSKVLTTSGVSAGTDGMIDWIRKVYGEEVATGACKWMEYIHDPKSDVDPFSDGLCDVKPTKTL